MGKRQLIAMLLVSPALLWAGPVPGEIYTRIDKNGVAYFTNAPTTPESRLLQPGGMPVATGRALAPVTELIQAVAAEHGIDSALIEAVIQVESNFNRRAVSPKGAQGLMQLMPATIWHFSVKDAYDPRENIGAGVRYLRRLLDRFHGDLTLALAAYNAGERAVLRYKGVPPYRETRAYVAKVMRLYRRNQGRRRANGAITRVVAAQPSSPEPPSSIYKAESSNTIVYSNIPPIVHSH